MNNFVGFLAAICTTASFIPQALKVYKTRKADDISLGMFLLMSAGVALWDIYGFMIGALPVVVANTITLVLSIYILSMKLKLNHIKSHSDSLL